MRTKLVMRNFVLLVAVLLSACATVGPNDVLSLDKAQADGAIPREKLLLFEAATWVTQPTYGALAITDKSIYYVIWDSVSQHYRRAWTIERSKVIDVSIRTVGVTKHASIYTADSYQIVYINDGIAGADGDKTERLKTILMK